jgi:hypothetical protein
LGLKRVEPQIDSWVEKARETAEILSHFDRISILPNPPQTNFFRLYIRGDAEALVERHKELAKETGTFIFYGLQPTMVPGTAVTEMWFQESSLTFDHTQLAPFVEKLFQE